MSDSNPDPTNDISKCYASFMISKLLVKNFGLTDSESALADSGDSEKGCQCSSLKNPLCNQYPSLRRLASMSSRFPSCS